MQELLQLVEYWFDFVDLEMQLLLDCCVFGQCVRLQVVGFGGEIVEDCVGFEYGEFCVVVDDGWDFVVWIDCEICWVVLFVGGQVYQYVIVCEFGFFQVDCDFVFVWCVGCIECEGVC